MRILALFHGRALEGKVRVVLIEPVELVEHARAVDFERGHRAEQIPEALEVVFHLAPTANHEAFLRLLDAVERAAGQLEPFENGDLGAFHLTVADEERGTGEGGESCSDKPGGFLVNTGGLARAGKRLVVSTAVVHAFSFSSLVVSVGPNPVSIGIDCAGAGISSFSLLFASSKIS